MSPRKQIVPALAIAVCLAHSSFAAQTLDLVLETHERETISGGKARVFARLRHVLVDPGMLEALSDRVLISDARRESGEHFTIWTQGKRSLFVETGRAPEEGVAFSMGAQRFSCRQIDESTSRSLSIDLQALANASKTGGTVRGVQMEENPTFSPDGDRMAFVVRVVLDDPLPPPSRPQWDTAVAVYDFATGIARIVAPFGYVNRQPAFSPDGETIAFYRAPFEVFQRWGEDSNDQAGHRLCVVPTAGGEVRVLSPPPNTLYPDLPDPPSWSPDGKRILFDARYNDPNVKPLQVDLKRPSGEWKDLRSPMLPVGVYCYDLDSDKMERMTPAEWGKGAGSPCWGPDGRSFVCSYQGKAAIIDSVTKEIRTLGEGSASHCRWSWKTNLIVYEGRGRVDNRPVHLLNVVTPDGKKRLEIPWEVRGFALAE